jgi:glycosyltransferase involved in cell wall biosynthesis
MKSLDHPRKMVKIAFNMMGGNQWYAGVSYLQNLFYALKENYKTRVRLCLLTNGQNEENENPLSHQVDEIVPICISPKQRVLRKLNSLIEGICSHDIGGWRFLKNSNIDVLFGPALSHRYGNIPTLSWIYDFQHIYLPSMFKMQESHFRDQLFLQTAKLSDRIVVMSEAVKKDFQAFLPAYAHKVRVLKPVSYIPESIYGFDSRLISDLYRLPEKFIYLPSQFWKHKNHELVFNAVKVLKDRKINIFLTCSGYPGDYRHDNYFGDLLRKVSELGIRDQIAILGLIPREHVLQLMRQSICVLNASLFEGFGLTVDEAGSMGKQVLISDIPVHREQNLTRCIYFNPCDTRDLVEKLEKFWKEEGPGPDMESEEAAQKILPSRIRDCANSFMRLIGEVVNQNLG